MSCVISRKAHKWFASINVDVGECHKERTSDGQVGVDLGLTHFAILSDGTKVNNPRFLKKRLKRIKRLQQIKDRKTKRSSNRKKATMKLAKAYYDVVNQRKDFQQKLSTKLCRENQAMAVETLNIRGMLKNHKLAQAIADASWSEFVRQLEYKSLIYGVRLVKADLWFASTKLCSDCGFKNDNLTLVDRTWTCPNCGETHDRDVNAAKNLENTLGLREIHACGNTTVRVNEAAQEALTRTFACVKA